MDIYNAQNFSYPQIKFKRLPCGSLCSVTLVDKHLIAEVFLPAVFWTETPEKPRVTIVEQRI